LPYTLAITLLSPYSWLTTSFPLLYVRETFLMSFFVSSVFPNKLTTCPGYTGSLCTLTVISDDSSCLFLTSSLLKRVGVIFCFSCVSLSLVQTLCVWASPKEPVLVRFSLLRLNTRQKQLKGGKVYFGSLFLRVQFVLGRPHCSEPEAKQCTMTVGTCGRHTC
jgi:hypothetical protein